MAESRPNFVTSLAVLRYGYHIRTRRGQTRPSAPMIDTLFELRCLDIHFDYVRDIYDSLWDGGLELVCGHPTRWCRETDRS